MLLNQFLILAAILFCIGVYGVLARKNGVMVLMSIELILNAVNINLVAFVLALVMGYVLWDAFDDQSFTLAGSNTRGLGQTTQQISDSIFSTYLVPFEAASVLLLAALIGAIVLARRD